MRYFSMFSGIGGFELGIERAYNNQYAHLSEESKSKECSQGRLRDAEEPRALLHSGEDTPLCIGFSEIDKYAIETYLKHFPEHKNYGNAREIDPDDLPDFDMLCGGFPCQSFSIAGKRKGFQDTRGTLFHEILRIAKAKRPRLLFLENVKGLLSADDGRCFATIISSLDELGYDVEWQVLNSKNFGVPQNRERVFIIGHLRGEPFKQVFPIGEMYKGIVERTTETSVNTITAGGDSGGSHSSMTILQSNDPDHPNDGVYSEEGISPSLNTAQGGDRQPKIKVSGNINSSQDGQIFDIDGISQCLSSGHGNNPKIVIPVLTPDRPEKRQNGRRFKEDGEEMFTLTGQDIHGIMLRDGRDDRSCLREGRTLEVGYEGQSIRRLTPIECERLQSFPDNWTIGSDTQRYKQCGNAVTVNVIEAIAKRIEMTTGGN